MAAELTQAQKTRIAKINGMLPAFGIVDTISEDGSNLSAIDSQIKAKFEEMKKEADVQKIIQEVMDELQEEIKAMEEFIMLQVQQKVESLKKMATDKATQIASDIASALIPGFSASSVSNPVAGVVKTINDTLTWVQETKTKIEMSITLTQDYYYSLALKAWAASAAKKKLADHKAKVQERAVKRQSKLEQEREEAEAARKAREESNKKFSNVLKTGKVDG